MSQEQSPDDRKDVSPSDAPASTLPRVVRSDELLRGQIEVLIEHGSDTYRLRLTRSGKLILQK